MIAIPQAATFATRYREVRRRTERLCEPLCTEDYVVQSMPDCSPAKWHLGHTSWFFETFVLQGALPDRRPLHPLYGHLFNSYYNSIGDRHARGRRGLLSRPSVEEIYRYRADVDRLVLDLLDAPPPFVLPIVELGLQHEQQHQELLLTDIQHMLAQNPLQPTYRVETMVSAGCPAPLGFVEFTDGLREIGHEGTSFAFDNEAPRHRVFVERFQLATRLVSCREYLAFMSDGGYRRPELWLSDGWDFVQREALCAPLYFEPGEQLIFSLAGPRPMPLDEPVSHVSYYEADAYARWAGARLPTEVEWEVAAASQTKGGNFLESGLLHPSAMGLAGPMAQIYGDVWEWTQSPYVAYPGYKAPSGALGEYNGKFMCNQQVLRGGSCLTPENHIRATYRNFFPPAARWQMAGLRLARDM